MAEGVNRDGGSDRAALKIVCPNCDAVNRVPDRRLKRGDKAICGKCRQALFNGRPIEATAARFMRHVERSDIPVLVDFWAPWCGPCKMMTPAFEATAKQLEPHLRLLKVNTDAEPAIATQRNIQSIPAMALFVGGAEIARAVGARNAAGIVDWVNQQLRA